MEYENSLEENERKGNNSLIPVNFTIIVQQTFDTKGQVHPYYCNHYLIPLECIQI